MISYEEAKSKATGFKKGLDKALEYKDAYVFYNSKANKNQTQNNEVVILKRNGEMVTMSEYVMISNDQSTPKKIQF